MSVQRFALIAGIVYLVAGVAGFIPPLLAPSDGPPLHVEALHGRLLGLFPVNVLHDIVHLAIGLWGVLVWRSATAARRYAQALAIIYGVLAVMGLLPVLGTTFGLIPIHGHDVWLHAATALVAAYFGFRREARPATA